MSPKDLEIMVAELAAKVASLEAAMDEPRDLAVETPPPQITRIVSVVVGGGKQWDRSAWTGTASSVLYCPYDGVTAPSYEEEMPEMTSMPADDGSDDRADGLYIDLARVPGPVFHVQRA